MLIDYDKSKGFGNGINEEDLKFLELSGRRAFYSQGIYGQGIIVAVLDTGVADHPELEGRILEGKSFIDYTRSWKDDNGHGTHVAGSIAGKHVGIAPQADILPVKVLDTLGNGDVEDILKALRWIARYRHKDGRRVTIVSMSLSVAENVMESGLKERFHKAIKALVDNNIAVICSAGNTYDEQLRYPASFDEVICVGAVDMHKKRALFSTMGNHVDLCQVGVDVLSCNYEGGYMKQSGTSMSTPIVSGVGALIACKYEKMFKKSISEELLWQMLKFNTKDLGIPGVDKEYGAGFCSLQPLEDRESNHGAV